ncbi:hypothetical protein MOQ_008087, partial [Trypanosoma cruzi marinkellei]
MAAYSFYGTCVCPSCCVFSFLALRVLAFFFCVLVGGCGAVSEGRRGGIGAVAGRVLRAVVSCLPLLFSLSLLLVFFAARSPRALPFFPDPLRLPRQGLTKPPSARPAAEELFDAADGRGEAAASRMAEGGRPARPGAADREDHPRARRGPPRTKKKRAHQPQRRRTRQQRAKGGQHKTGEGDARKGPPDAAPSFEDGKGGKARHAALTSRNARKKDSGEYCLLCAAQIRTTRMNAIPQHCWRRM